MGLLATAYGGSVHIQKPDFVQLVGQLPAGTTGGCKWCFKTIFFNGSFWNHVERDQHKCDYNHVRHDCEQVGTQKVEVAKTLWKERPIYQDGPVWRCKNCGQQDVAKYSYGEFRDGIWGECPVKVATPAEPSRGIKGRDG